MINISGLCKARSCPAHHGNLEVKGSSCNFQENKTATCIIRIPCIFDSTYKGITTRFLREIDEEGSDYTGSGFYLPIRGHHFSNDRIAQVFREKFHPLSAQGDRLVSSISMQAVLATGTSEGPCMPMLLTRRGEYNLVPWT